MANSRTRRVKRRGGAWRIPVIVLVLVALAGAGAYRLGYLNDTICGGPCGAAFVEPPDSLVVAPSVDSAKPLATVPDGAISGEKVRQAVSPLLESAALGSDVGFSAIDLGTGSALWTIGDKGLIPASTNKLFTAFSALSTMDAQHRFSTAVRLDGADGIILVGGGDPYLQAKARKKSAYPQMATIPDLAAKTARSLKTAGITTVGLAYDASLFSGPAQSPDWEPSYVTGNIVTRISALWVDKGIEGPVRATDPANAAARTFADALRKVGVTVEGEIESTEAPPDSKTIALVLSPTVGQIIELTNLTSDNEAAEVMFRQVALATGRPGSFTGGQEAVASTLENAGIDLAKTRILDGSGLSRQNATTAKTLASTLYAASQRQRTKALLADLPVAGFNGSLGNRFITGSFMSALGLLRAKTGTLTGVQGLAGVTVDADGRGIIFAVLGNGAPAGSTYAGRAATERVAAALTRCRCG